MRFWIAAVTLCIPLWGCYTFSPVTSDDLSQGTEVRAYLAPPQSVELQDVTARSVVELDAEVVSLTSDRAVLSAFWVVSEEGFERPGGGATVQLDRSSIRELHLKRFDPLRTGGLFAAGIGVAFFLFDALFDAGGGGEGGGGGGQPL